LRLTGHVGPSQPARQLGLAAQALRQLASSHNTRWCKGLNFCGRRNRVPRADVHDPLREVTGYPGGAARELLDHVADIANVLAHQNACSVNDPPKIEPAKESCRAARACPENEVASIPMTVSELMPRP